MTRSAKCVFAPGNVVIHLEAGHRRIVRVMFFKMSIYARSGRLGLADDEPVEEHPERGEVLLDARRRERTGEWGHRKVCSQNYSKGPKHLDSDFNASSLRFCKPLPGLFRAVWRLDRVTIRPR